MTQRLSRMEGALDGLKHNQTITFGAIAMVSTILVAVSSYTLLKIDALSARFDARIGTIDARIDRLDLRMGALETSVAELPGRISTDIRGITSTLAQAITASRQAPPQVIVIPAPANGAGQPPQTP